VLIVDNVLWKGRVVELEGMSPEERVARSQERQKKGVMSLVEADKYAAAMHQFNTLVKDDNRVENVMLPMRDGLSIIRRVA
jgi:predicted O-methyltransferase YrrM